MIIGIDDPAFGPVGEVAIPAQGDLEMEYPTEFVKQQVGPFIPGTDTRSSGNSRSRTNRRTTERGRPSSWYQAP